MPEWYPLLKAAKWLGVAPWDLMNQPRWWMDWAMESMAAEAEAEKARRNSSIL